MPDATVGAALDCCVVLGGVEASGGIALVIRGRVGYGCAVVCDDEGVEGAARGFGVRTGVTVGGW